MSKNRIAKLAAIAALGTLTLTACNSTAEPGANQTTDTQASTGSEGTTGGNGNGPACPPGTLAGEGSSAQKNAIETAMAMYAAECAGANQINYNATGSGNGIKQFIAAQADFAGSDSVLSDDEVPQAEERCGGAPAWHLPMVVGPVAFAYNLDGVDTLVMNPEVLGQIFNGQITKWNDEAIAAINEGVALPDADITVFFRSDSSGTTDNTTNFLHEAAPEAWPHEPSKEWAGVGEGKQQNQGIAAAMAQTPNSISYMEWSFAVDNNLGIAQLDTGNGPTELSAEAVGIAVDGAEIVGEGNDLQLSLKYTDAGEGAYPAILVTYEIVCSEGLEAEKTALLKDFLSFYAAADTQAALQDVGYAPLPEGMISKVTSAIEAIA